MISTQAILHYIILLLKVKVLGKDRKKVFEIAIPSCWGFLMKLFQQDFETKGAPPSFNNLTKIISIKIVISFVIFLCFRNTLFVVNNGIL